MSKIVGASTSSDVASWCERGLSLLHHDILSDAYFAEISQDTGQYIFGVDDTLRTLEMGAVQKLIVWENLDVIRYTLRDHAKDGRYGKLKRKMLSKLTFI